MHILKEGAAGQRWTGSGNGPGRQGLGAAYLFRPIGWGYPGPTKTSQDPQVRTLGPVSPATSAARGRVEKGVGARCGQAGRKSPLSSTFTPPRRELPAVGYSSSVTFRESEVQTSRGPVSSSQRRPWGPALPRPAAFRPRPSPLSGPAPRRELPSRTVSGPALRPRLQPPGREHVRSPDPAPARGPLARRPRRDFRPAGSRKMAASVGICGFVFRHSHAEAFSLSAQQLCVIRQVLS